ncbi:VOC family protein [Qipengyuania spongiae]|uniref:Lactoylglutathione lyase n=1 Tax=Qipengyuania spongiae TaxID=2909673 RepID=A0ABY5T2I5_9SPHN|nr:VOC family protein [Qipengyuania spongiae]UVI39556.1 lactoylglutathione lyase [Qipengyuania spongiae]
MPESHSPKVFLNFPVADLDRSAAFYAAIGFRPEPNFTDETAAALSFGDRLFVMLLTHDKWKTFTTKDIPDANRSAQVMVALSLPDRVAVDAMVEAADAHGGTADVNPAQEHDFMYGRDFADPDGHIWEPHWLDESACGDAK